MQRYFSHLHCWALGSGEEIINANSTINNKSSKFTCYELLWLSKRNGKKHLSLFTRTDLSLSIKINFNLTTGKGFSFLHLSFENWNFTIPRMLYRHIHRSCHKKRLGDWLMGIIASRIEFYFTDYGPVTYTSHSCHFCLYLLAGLESV